MSLQFPVLNATRISSRVGPRNISVPGASRDHKGIDIAAPRGSPVVAPVDMRVISAGQMRGYGNIIIGRDSAGTEYRFGHLNSMNVRAGQTIPMGQTIGGVGSTGTSGGNHLHFEMRDRAGRVLNPERSGLNVRDVGTRAVSGALNSALDRGTELLATGAKNVLDGLLPGSGTLLGATGLLPGGGPTLLEQFATWIAETGFFQRLALALIALILIAGAVFLIKGSDALDIAKGITK